MNTRRRCPDSIKGDCPNSGMCRPAKESSERERRWRERRPGSRDEAERTVGKRLPKGVRGGRSSTGGGIGGAEMLEELEFGVGQDRSGAGCVEQMSEKEERRTEEKDMEANDGTEKENGIGTRMSVTRS